MSKDYYQAHESCSRHCFCEKQRILTGPTTFVIEYPAPEDPPMLGGHLKPGENPPMVWKLNAEESVTFLNLLDNPPKPTQAMIDLFNVKPDQPSKCFNDLQDEWGEKFDKMQEPGYGEKMQKVMAATPKELGQSAVIQAQKEKIDRLQKEINALKMGKWLNSWRVDCETWAVGTVYLLITNTDNYAARLYRNKKGYWKFKTYYWGAWSNPTKLNAESVEQAKHQVEASLLNKGWFISNPTIVSK